MKPLLRELLAALGLFLLLCGGLWAWVGAALTNREASRQEVIRAASEPSRTPVVAMSTSSWPSPTTTATPAPCDAEGMDKAAMHYLYPRIKWLSDLGVAIGTDSAADVLTARQTIERYRSWAATLDPCSRAAYEHWLDWYEGRANEAAEELQTHAKRREMDEYRHHLAADVAAVERSGIPTPPNLGGAR